MAGWISLHRKLMDNPIYSNANMLKLWIHCLLKATHTNRNQLVGKQIVQLAPGEFVTGRKVLKSEFNAGANPSDEVSESTLWRWLELFETLEMLNIKSTTKYSVISVINWSDYQGDEQQMNNKRTTNEQPLNTNNNVNKGNNDNKKDSSHKRVYDKDSLEMKIASFFYECILKNNANHKQPNLQSWANEIRLMLEVDNRNKDEIGNLIRWVQNDSFEMANVLSPTKLRKRYDALLIKMKQQPAAGKVVQMPAKPVEEFELDYSKGES